MIFECLPISCQVLQLLLRGMHRPHTANTHRIRWIYLKNRAYELIIAARLRQGKLVLVSGSGHCMLCNLKQKNLVMLKRRYNVCSVGRIVFWYRTFADGWQTLRANSTVSIPIFLRQSKLFRFFCYNPKWKSSILCLRLTILLATKCSHCEIIFLCAPIGVVPGSACGETCYCSNWLTYIPQKYLTTRALKGRVSPDLLCG